MFEILHHKWSDPIVERLTELPEITLDALISEVIALNDKYSTTYSDIDSEIQRTEQKLSLLIDELVGNEFDLAALNKFKALLGGE